MCALKKLEESCKTLKISKKQVVTLSTKLALLPQRMTTLTEKLN